MKTALVAVCALIGAPLGASPRQPISHQDGTPALDSKGPELVPEPQRPGLLRRPDLERVHVHWEGSDSVWLRGQDYRAHAGEGAFTVLPVFGKRAPSESPLRFQLTGVHVGRQDLDLAPAVVSEAPGRVTLDHGTVREIYLAELGGVEQTFRFDALPDRGELTLEIGVETDLLPDTGAATWLFRHPDLGHVTYGEAQAYDARGVRCEVERTWTGDGIRLTVPREFVEAAELPLVVDPPITFFSNGVGSPDDSNPDICWAWLDWWMCWEEFTSATNSDVWVTSFDEFGVQGPRFAVEMTNESWTEPRIAHSRAVNRMLVVARGDNGTSRFVRGQLVDPAAATLFGPPLTFAIVAGDVRSIDVGGQKRSAVEASNYCVVWAVEQGTGNWDVEYQVLDAFGADVGPPETVDSSTSLSDSQVTISNSRGTAAVQAGGGIWTAAWIRRPAGPGSEDLPGDVWVREIDDTGDPLAGSGNVVVNQSGDCLRPSISSRLHSPLPAAGGGFEFASVVVYEREQVNTQAIGPPTYGTIFGNVLVLPSVQPAFNLSDVLEDIDPPTDRPLDRRNPTIASDDYALLLGYQELWHGSSLTNDYDMYMASGHVVETPGGRTLALAERHQNLAFSGNREDLGRIATKVDSGASDQEAAIAWMSSSFGGGIQEVEGAIVKVPDELLLNFRAIGVQFCDAEPNSANSLFTDTNSSWMFARGDQNSGLTTTIYCVDLPVNQFGYMFASTTPANIFMPGTSVGRLCMTGSGRYIDQVQSSGIAGRFETVVDSNAIVTPTGTVAAAPGETWYFQYWHRDLVGGMFTSNFSAAVSVVFQP